MKDSVAVGAWKDLPVIVLVVEVPSVTSFAGEEQIAHRTGIEFT